MTSGRGLGLCLGALALAQGLLARSAAATPLDLEIDCRGLSAELQASLEARARADLSMKRLEGWHLRVTCDGARASVAFTPAGGLVSERQGALAGEPEDWVDRVLSLVHEAAAVADEAAPPASAAEFPAGREPPEAIPPAAEPVRPVERPAPIAMPADERTRHASTGGGVALRLEPEVSLDVEVWTAEPLVLVGPAASVGVVLAPRLRIAPTVAAAWSAGSKQDVAVRLLEAGADAVVGERWWLALGGRVGWLRFEPRQALSPVTRAIVDPSLVLRGGLSVSVGSGRVSASLGARAYAERRDVRVDGVVVLRVPNVAALGTVGYAAELL